MAGSITCALQTATGPPASALERRIELTNNTPMPIVEIYISPVRSERWNTNLLGDDYLEPKSSLVVHPGPPRCRHRRWLGCGFDFKTVFDDGGAGYGQKEPGAARHTAIQKAR
jgi:hypothetical protein